MFLRMNQVAIAATLFLSSQNAGTLQVGDDTHGGTLGNSDPVGDVSHAGCRILSAKQIKVCAWLLRKFQAGAGSVMASSPQVMHFKKLKA